MSNRSSRPVCRLSFVATALLCALHGLATSVWAQVSISRPPIVTAMPPEPELHMHLLEHDVVTHASRGELSPDGKRIVYVKVVEADSKFGPAGIESKDLKSGEIAQLTPKGLNPTFSSKDGKWIAYQDGSATGQQIWLMTSSGKDAHCLGPGTLPCWGPDGSTLYFYSFGEKAVMKIDIESSSPKPEKVIDVPSQFASISPDATRVATRDGNSLVIIDTTSGDVIKKYAKPGVGGFHGAISPDNRLLVVTGDPNSIPYGTWIVDLTSDTMWQLTAAVSHNPAWSADGSILSLTFGKDWDCDVWLISRDSLNHYLDVAQGIGNVAIDESADIESLKKALDANKKERAQASAQYTSDRSVVQGTYQARIGLLDSAQVGIATRICDLVEDKTSDTYLAAYEIMLPQLTRSVGTLAPEELEELLDNAIAVFRAKKPEELTYSRFNIVYSLSRALETSGNTELAARAYKEFDELFAKSKDTYVARYRARLTTAAKRLAIIGQPMTIEGTTFDGDTFDWASYRGKVVLVDFWATWCGPCLAEAPNVKRCYDIYHDQGFDVVGISLDRDRNALTSYLESKKTPWITLHEKEANGVHPTAKLYGISSIPTMYLVDREGKIISVNARGSRLRSLLAEHLGSPLERGKAAAIAGKWDEAVVALQLAVDMDPTQSDLWLALAAAQSAAGDREGFAATCKGAIDRFAKSSSLYTQKRLLRLCASARGGPVQDERLTASAAKLPGNIEPTGPALAVGMLEFRRGQFEKALEILPQNGDDLQVPLSAFFQAMALHHLGKKEEAKKRFMDGSTELAKRLPSPEGKECPDYMPSRWVVWTVLHNARREAESLLADSISGTDEKILRLLFQGDISKAIDELDSAIKAAPDNVVLRKQRADLCVRNQQWGQAARDLEAMLDDDNSNSMPWLEIGALFALSADEKEYQRYCRAMAQRFKDSETTNDPERVVKIAMLRPGVDEKTLPIERFEAFFQSDSPPSWLPTWGTTARALLEFRRGNAQRSLDLANRCEEVLGKATSPSRSLHALNCAIQSLALAKLEKVNEARDALAQATEILDPEMELIRQGEQWSHDYLIAQVIRREAEQAINK